MASTNSGIKLPVAPLKIAALDCAADMAAAVNQIILETRRQRLAASPALEKLAGYAEDSFLLDCRAVRYGTGEARVKINESIRGADVYILSDVTNSSITYKVRGLENHMSPDNHFQDLKRLISALDGKAYRVNVIMPFLYESRQHKRTGRESLDCALALRELADYGVADIITFDAHDPRVMNSIPLCGFDNFMPTYQILQALKRSVPDLNIDKEHFMVVSPDEGAMKRGMYFSDIIGVDMGTFYKRRDYSKVVDGKNPIVAHEFLGDSVEGKDIIVIDDMIASGGSMLDVCRQLKEKGCRRVFVCATFGLFTNGLKAFDEYYEKGLMDRLITTNLTYQTPELLKRPYYVTADMYRYLANIIDTLNHDSSTSGIKSTTSKINSLLESEASR